MISLEFQRRYVHYETNMSLNLWYYICTSIEEVDNSIYKYKVRYVSKYIIVHYITDKL